MDYDSLILVTGSNGMVGKSLVKNLQKKGFLNLLLPTSKDLNLVTQAETDYFFNNNNIDYVFHLAGRIGGIGANIDKPSEFLYENMMMAFNVINASYTHKINKLLFLGSSCIYPINSKQPMKEEYLLSGPLEPTNEGYALAKISGIKLCNYMNKQHNTNYLCLIPPNLYGFNDHFNDKGAHVISSLIYKFHAAKIENLPEVEMWGTGSSKREFMFVDDISDAMIYFISNFKSKAINNFLNVGTGEEVSILELAKLIKDIVGFQGLLKFNKNKPDGMPNKLMDNRRSFKLGWEPKIKLQEGLILTYEWYKKELNAV